MIKELAFECAKGFGRGLVISMAATLVAGIVSRRRKSSIKG